MREVRATEETVKKGKWIEYESNTPKSKVIIFIIVYGGLPLNKFQAKVAT